MEGLGDMSASSAMIRRAWLFLEPAKAPPLAAQAAEHGSATTKVLTITALAESGATWRRRYRKAFAAAYDDHPEGNDPALANPLRTTVEALVSHGHKKEALRLLVLLLSPERRNSTGEVALALAEKLAERRKMRAPLLSAVLPLLWTRHSAEDAVRFVERFGRKNTEAIDALATLASTPNFPGSQQALAMLIDESDAQATVLLAVHIAELTKPRPRNDAEGDYQSVFWRLQDRQPDFDALLLNAVRTWMRTWPREPDWSDEPGGPKNTTLDLLAHWGPAAHAATPELLRILPNHYLKALPTLRAITPTEEELARIDPISQ